MKVLNEPGSWLVQRGFFQHHQQLRADYFSMSPVLGIIITMKDIIFLTAVMLHIKTATRIFFSLMSDQAPCISKPAKSLLLSVVKLH